MNARESLFATLSEAAEAWPTPNKYTAAINALRWLVVGLTSYAMATPTNKASCAARDRLVASAKEATGIAVRAPWYCACSGAGRRSEICERCLTCGTFAPWLEASLCKPGCPCGDLTLCGTVEPRSASRALEESPEWLAIRAEEDRLESELRALREQKGALVDKALAALPEYP